MDVDYWRSRCEAAESALQRARCGLHWHPVRAEAIAALGDLKPDEAIGTKALARKLQWSSHRVIHVMATMERVGLVDRATQGRCGGRGREVRWKLGHLVQVVAE